MADIKISEIANKASISDLSNARYIVSVPSAGDSTAFSTKYALGADLFNFGGGGFIDTLTPVSNNGPTLSNGGAVQFENFDPSTQVIFFLSNGGGIVPEAATTSTAHQWSTNITIRRNSTGLVQVKSNNSNSNGASIPLFRFTKVASNTASSTVNEQTGTTYTLQASDYGKILNFTNSNAITVTLPQNLGGYGFNCTIIQDGSGQISFSANTGSTATLYERRDRLKTAGKYAVVYLTSCAPNRFILSGDTGV
jgi:hypothetical protein